MKLNGLFILSVTVVIFFIYSQQKVQAEQELELSSKAKNEKKEIFYTCLKDKEMRWMRLTYLPSGKCKTVYSKKGNATEVVSAASYQKCEETIANVRKNLESGGYVCREKTLLGELEID